MDEVVPDEKATLLFLVRQAIGSAVPLTLCPLAVVGHRRSVGHRPAYGGVREEVGLIWRQSGLSGHPGFFAWVGAVEGALDVLLTTVGSALELSCLPAASPSAGGEGQSPYTQSWQRALLAGVERAAFTFLARPLRRACHRLLAQLPDAQGQYRLSGELAVVRSLWAEEGLACFTRWFMPALVLELTQSVLYSVHEAAAPCWCLSERYGSRVLRPLSLACDQALRSLLIALVTQPLETVVRRLDVQGSGVEPPRLPYKGAVECAARILREEGFGGFYQGVTLELAIALVQAGTVFVTDLIMGYYVVRPPSDSVESLGL